MIRDRRYNAFSVLIFSLMGAFLAANQAIVANVAEALGGSEAEMGYMVSALYLGSMLAVPFEGELAVAFGKRIAVVISALMVCVGAVLMLICQSIPVAIIGLAVYGAGIGGYESINMSLVADNRQEDSNQFLNLLQALFSIGAMVSPLIIARYLRSNEFRPMYAVLLGCYAFLLLYFLMDRRIDTFASRDKKEENGFVFLKLMKNGKMLIYMLAMFIYLGSETALTFWIGSLYTQAGIGEYGAMALSAYWFASIFGRLLGSRVKSPRSIVVPCFAVGAAGYFVVAFVPGVIAKTLAVIVMGIAFAPLYAGIAIIGGELFPEYSAPAFSLMIFAAGLGGVLFQPIISLFLSSGNAAAAYWIAGILSAITALVLAVMQSKEKLHRFKQDSTLFIHVGYKFGGVPMKKTYSIKDDFSTLAMLFIPLGVAINFVGGQVASLLKLPVYLDCIGTVLTAMLSGPWVGAVTGLLTNVVTGIANPVNFWFIPVNVIVGLVVGFLARKDMWKGWKLVISFIIMDLVSLFVSTPIVVYVYGGVTGSGTSLLTAVLMATGQSIWASVFSVEIIWTTLDRILAYLVAFLIIKVIPAKTLVKFSLGEFYIGKKAAVAAPVEEVKDAFEEANK